MAQIGPDAQTNMVLGAVVVSVGQAIVVFGAVRLVATRLLSGLASERQMTTAYLAKSIEQLQYRWQSERQALMANYTQTMAKLDGFVASQKEANMDVQSKLPVNCKFCGAKIETGSFCTSCGKSNR